MLKKSVFVIIKKCLSCLFSLITRIIQEGKTGMKIGIVGLPNVGKSTLFNAITKAGAECANYPFCTIEPNIGVVAVPDERLMGLAAMHQIRAPPAVVPAKAGTRAFSA